MARKVLFVTGNVSQNNGGSKSFLELYNVWNSFVESDILAVGIHMDRVSAKRKLISSNIISAKSLKFNSVFYGILYKYSPKYYSKWLGKYINRNTDYSLVVLNVPLILEGCETKILFHHNGSFTKILGSYSYLGKAQSYDHLLSYWDGRLFQSILQMNSSVNVSWKLQHDVTINPVIDESALSKVSNRNVDKSIIMIGSIQERKGYMDLISLLTPIKKYGFKVSVFGEIADKAYYDELVSRIETIDCGDLVSFRGFSLDYIDHLAAASLVIHLAHDEGVSRTIREAAYLRKPILCYKIDGNIEVLGENYLLMTDLGDALSLQNNLKNFLEASSHQVYSSNYPKSFLKSNYYQSVQEYIRTLDL